MKSRAGGRTWTALGCALGAGLAAATATAACGEPDVLDTVPLDGAVNVPPNASLLAHYDISADYGGEEVQLTVAGGTPEVVPVTFDAAQGLLTFTPPAPLAPGDYTVRWPGLRGLTAARGLGRDVRFSVGATADVAAPAFDGVSAVSWDLERKTNDCTDALEPRFVFDLALAAADDDGGRGNLTLVVFQTAGPSIAGGGVAVLTRAMPAPGAAARVKLPVGDAVGRVCFAALARDLTGKTSNGGSHEVCVHTTAPPFFHGCGVAPAHGRAQVRDGLAGVLVMLTIAARARRRRAS